jgi:hypothetical protein
MVRAGATSRRPHAGRAASTLPGESQNRAPALRLPFPAWLARTGQWLELHDAATALGVALAAFGLYLGTLAPSLTIAHNGTDGGDLIAAAWTGGVPHPTGYPTYILAARLFTRLPWGSVAYRVNLLSAVCAAAAVGLTYRVVRLSQRPPGDSAQGADPATRSGRQPFERWALAVAAATSVAASPLLWSQALIAEVYALHALFAALVLWCAAEWEAAPRDRWLWAAGLCLGLGLGNHLTLGAVALAAGVWLLPHWRRWLHPRTLAPAAGLGLVGLSVYAYLPLAARGDPPVNWGDPQTWRGFWWVVSGAQYRPFVFGLEATYIPGRLYEWAGLLGAQFGWWGLVLALAGLACLWGRRRSLARATLVLWGVLAVYAFGYRPGDSYVYLLPACLVMGVWWAEGGAYLLALIKRRWARRLALLALALLPLVSAGLHWGEMDLSDDRSAVAYTRRVLDEEGVAMGSLLVTRRDGPTFMLWYAHLVEGQRPDLAIVNGPLLAFPWYREQVRQRHPGLLMAPEAETPETPARDLMLRNLPLRGVYATDPADEWREWFAFDPLEPPGVERGEGALVWRARIRGTGGRP